MHTENVARGKGRGGWLRFLNPSPPPPPPPPLNIALMTYKSPMLCRQIRNRNQLFTHMNIKSNQLEHQIKPTLYLSLLQSPMVHIPLSLLQSPMVHIPLSLLQSPMVHIPVFSALPPIPHKVVAHFISLVQTIITNHPC